MRTSLQIAARSGYTNIFALLIESGVGINGPGGRFDFALPWHLGSGSAKIAAVLVKNRGDFDNLCWHFGIVPRGSAYLENPDIAARLTEMFADSGGRFAIAPRGSVLTENGADVNTPGGHLHTSFETCLFTESMGEAMLLIEDVGGIRAPGGDFGTPVQVTANSGNAKIVTLLLEKGARS